MRQVRKVPLRVQQAQRCAFLHGMGFHFERACPQPEYNFGCIHQSVLLGTPTSASSEPARSLSKFSGAYTKLCCWGHLPEHLLIQNLHLNKTGLAEEHADLQESLLHHLCIHQTALHSRITIVVEVPARLQVSTCHARR